MEKERLTNDPVIVINNAMFLCPQDILVASSLSFGGSHQISPADPGKDVGRKNPGWENEVTEEKKTSSSSGVIGHKFQPSEFVSASSRTTPGPQLRKGTVEDIPPPRPTLPPVVKTSGLELREKKHTEHGNHISSTPVPVKMTTFKTSKIDLLGDYRDRADYYNSYLKDLLGDIEEPSRSTEVIEPSADHMRYGVQSLPPGAYFPRQREPYPYQNMAAPLPYLRPPKPPIRRPPPPPQRADLYDRENLLGNRLENLRKIDAHNRNQNKYQQRTSVEKYPQNEREESSEHGLSSLTLAQLSSKLALTTPIPDMEARTEDSREYTVFDMADAVTITMSPEEVTEDSQEEDERLSNHRNPPFMSYSEAAPNRVRVSRIGDSVSRDYNTLRPDYIEVDQSPSPASNNEHKLMVDMTTVQDTLRNKRNVSVDDLLFLYNITFLTDSKEIVSSIGDRDIKDHNIDIPDTNAVSEEYEDSYDYDTIPLPDYQALDSEDKFKNALNEFLEDYEDYSREQVRLKHDDSSQSPEVDHVEDLLTKIMGDSSVPEELLEDMFEDEDYYEPGWDLAAGHAVNHRTHSVPEFANKLISAQRQGGQSHQTMKSSSEMRDTDVLVNNHKPFSPSDQLGLTNNDGIKEVLMVLNATGKVSPKNRTHTEGVPRLEDTEAHLIGYYPENYDVDSEYYEDIIEEIDDDIENISGPGQDYWASQESRDTDEMRFTELDNDINTESAETTEETEEEKKYYPVKGDTTHEENDTNEIIIDPQNLSDKILNSWDTHSDEILSNDQFIDELERERLEKIKLKELLGTESAVSSSDSENFPLKSLMADSEASSVAREQEKQLDTETEGSINPEKLAYILIGVSDHYKHNYHSHMMMSLNAPLSCYNTGLLRSVNPLPRGGCCVHWLQV